MTAILSLARSEIVRVLMRAANAVMPSPATILRAWFSAPRLVVVIARFHAMRWLMAASVRLMPDLGMEA